ncbi:MAG: hypothetical protein ABIJ34_04475 [archaeon]
MAALADKYTLQEEDVALVIGYIMQSPKVKDTLNYAKAFYMEIISLDKYLGRLIWHRRLRNYYEVRTLIKILNSRIDNVSKTIEEISKGLSDPIKEGVSIIAVIASIDTHEFKEYLQNNRYGAQKQILQNFESLKLLGDSEFMRSYSEFMEVMSAINLLAKDKEEIARKEYTNKQDNGLEEYKKMQRQHLDGFFTDLVRFKQRTHNLIIRMNKLKHVKEDIQIFHFHDLPDTKYKREYLLHLVGGLGSNAGRAALLRFLMVLSRAGYLVGSPNEVYESILYAPNAIQNERGVSVNPLSRFRIRIDNEDFLVLFTNDEDKIASRQDYFSLPPLIRELSHFTGKDYVYDMAKIINRDKFDATLVYIICNTASAPDELRRLSHVTHCFFYDLPGGFVKYLVDKHEKKMICFLSTQQLYHIGTYQQLAKGHLTVYESTRDFKLDSMMLNERESSQSMAVSQKISKMDFYHKLTQSVINVIKDCKSSEDMRRYIQMFLELLGYIDAEGEIVIGLCCTELPIVYQDIIVRSGELYNKCRDELEEITRAVQNGNAQGSKYEVIDRTLRYKGICGILGIGKIKFIFEDPLDVGNVNVVELLKRGSVIEDKHSILGPQDYRTTTRNQLFDWAVDHIRLS